MVLFGGTCASTEALALSLGEDPRWEALEVRGSPPSHRAYHSAIYDPLRRRMIVFGGVADAAPLGDLWELSLDGAPTWRRLAPQGAGPLPRHGHNAIYDPDADRMILFGGSASPMSESHLLNDLWELPLSTLVWAPLNPSGVYPTRRMRGSAIHDPVRRRMILYGGLGDGPLNELHELSLQGALAWAAIPTTSAPTNHGHAAFYDAAADRMIVWNTSSLSPSRLAFLNLSGSPVWSEASVPSPNYVGAYQAGVFDPVYGRLMMFGGAWDGGTLIGVSCRDDTWMVDLATATMRRLFETVPDLSNRSLVLDSTGDRGIAIGGNPQGTFETWQLGLDATGLWQALPADGSASARQGYAAVIDSARNRILVFGGHQGQTYLNDVWVLSLGEHPTWSALEVTNPPPPMILNSGVIDPVGDRMVVMGISLDPIRNELWALDLEVATWERLEPAGDPPPLLSRPALVYDPLRHRVLVVGGADTTFDRFSVRAFDLGPEPTWSKVPATGAPPQRSGHFALFDAVRDRLVFYGGQEGASMNDVWALDFAGDLVWRMLEPPGGAPYLGAATHDPRRDRMIVLTSTELLILPPATWQLRWGQELGPVVACPPIMAWPNPGSTLLLQYSITNPSNADRAYDWVLTHERDWPRFPRSGTVSVPSKASTPIAVEILVPDSAGAGLSRLRFSAYEAGGGDTSFCEHFIGDLATPTLVSSLPPELHDFTLVLRWQVTRNDWSRLDVERRERTGEWQVAGAAVSEGRDILRFTDDTVMPGVPYAYRLVVPMADGDARMGYIETTLPSTSLAVRVERLDSGARSLSLEFSLPSLVAARLEVFDTSGRRVRSRPIVGHAGGRQVVELDIAGLEAGVYFVRLTQAGLDARARFALVR